MKKMKIKNDRIGIMITKQHLLNTDNNSSRYNNIAQTECLGNRNDLNEIASNLFYCLRNLDNNDKIDIIFCEMFPLHDIGIAIMNRLIKASSCKMIMSLHDLQKYHII